MGDSAQEKPSSSCASSFDLSQLQNELECCICLNLFEDPKQLQCGHICCAACIQGLIDLANEPGVVGILFGGKSPYKTISCPQCREENRVPAEGQFQTAFVVKNLVSHVKQAEAAANSISKKTVAMCQCAACQKSVPAEELYFCVTCHDFEEETEDKLDLLQMIKPICPLCACKLHMEHKMVPAGQAQQAIVDEKKRLLAALATDGDTTVSSDESKEAEPEPSQDPSKEEEEGKEKSRPGKGTGSAGQGGAGNPRKLAKAEELRRQGNEAYARQFYEEAIRLYTLSIREWPSSVCHSNRAQTNLKIGRYSLAYVDANEALVLDPDNEKAKARRETALDWMGMGHAEQKAAGNAGNGAAKPSPSTPPWPKNVRLCQLSLCNEEYLDEALGGVVPQNVNCEEEASGRSTLVPLGQLDRFLNEHVQGTVPRIVFKFVKFDEPMVQMLGRVKRERFGRVKNTEGTRQKGYEWLNCDFSALSEGSFRLLLDQLFSPLAFELAEWVGMPRGFDYNRLFQLRAFRDAVEVDFGFGDRHPPQTPGFNIHLDPEVLIDFLYRPGFRTLHLVDGHLHGGFDPFLRGLIQRFEEDGGGHFYHVEALLLEPTAYTKGQLKQPLCMEHPEHEYDGAILQLKNIEVSLLNRQAGHRLVEFEARRFRTEADLFAIRRYYPPSHGHLLGGSALNFVMK